MKRRITDKQLAANRTNAARSTGPRSAEGKRRAAQNSRKHGLVSAAVSIVRLEDQGELDNLRADAIAAYQPQNSQETFAVERIAIAQLAMLRSYRLEAGMFITALNSTLNSDGTLMYRVHEQLIPDEGMRLEQNRNYALAQGLEKMANRNNAWSLVLRYQAQAERQYRRAIEEFERLQCIRDEIPNEPISSSQLTEGEPLDPSQNEPISSADAPAIGMIPNGAADEPAVP